MVDDEEIQNLCDFCCRMIKEISGRKVYIITAPEFKYEPEEDWSGLGHE